MNDALKVQIFQLVESGGAFQNPVSESISNLQAIVADQLQNLTVLEAIGDPTGIPNWMAADLTSLLATIALLDAELSLFATHTDRISGVGFPPPPLNTSPSFLALLGVSSNLFEVEQKIGGTTTDTITDFFGSLSEFPPKLDGWSNSLSDFDLKIQMIPPFVPPSYPNQPDPIQTISDISGWTSQMSSKRLSENASYDSAVGTLTRWAVSSILPTQNSVWKDFVKDVVATPGLKTILSNV